MITLNSQVQANENQVSCDLAGDAAIMDLKNGRYYGLDPVGATIWELIQQPVQVSALIAQVLEEYEVESERCTSDVIALLQELQSHDLINVTE